MTFLAGIVRRDGRVVPDEWTSRLAHAGLAQAGAGVEKIRTLPSGPGDAVFLASEFAVKQGQDAALLLCDARLDERDMLAGDLPPDADDADVVACGHRRWGDVWIDGLAGDVALAAWDPTFRRLRLARSQLGTRPLFFTEHEAVFAFASTLRALLALPFVSRGLDEATICRVLCFDGSGPADATYYGAVRRLPAAHRLTLDEGGISVEVMPKPASQSFAPTMANAPDPAETARRLIIDAVECRMRAGETIAVHLSGGLDSSAIACIAARRLRQQGRRLLALCSVLPAGHTGPEADEREFISAVLAQEDNIDPVWVEMPADCDPFGALPRWFDCLGEPPYSNVTHAEERLGEIGRAHGADVALSGFGGDFFVSAMVMSLPAALLSRGRWGAAAAGLWQMRRATGLPWSRLVREQVLRPLAGRYRPSRTGTDMGSACSELADRIEQREGRRPMSTVPGMARASAHETMRFILAPGHVERVLPATRQVFVEQFGQDLRFPMLDPRLVAFVLGLGEKDLNCDGQSRSLMRRAMAGILPEAVRLRPDKGPAFDPALAAHCARARPALRQWAETAAPRCWDYVDKPRLLAALDAMGPTGRAGWRNDMFSVLLTGGRIAKFVDWHARAGGETCN